MRAAIFHEPGNVTAWDRPDATIKEPSDAVVRVVLACVCGSDLWYYRGDSQFRPGPIGHEFIGVVEEVSTGRREPHEGRTGDLTIRLQRRHLRLGAVEEIQIAIRRDGTAREPRLIWIVRAPDRIYVRAAHGHRSSPHSIAAGTLAGTSVVELVDAGYREKYGSHYPRTLIRP
ncbi:MAG TPA: DUF2255 family protein [Solirubrobacteraceae bacterium]|nr:DUF2255 family protein [Solirubrobacteraceae bacterium]